MVASTPLDDFLSDTRSTDTGDLLQRLGLFGSLFGVTLALGLLVFMAVVHRGSRTEVAVLLRLVAVAGGATLIGATVELAGIASLGELSWSEALADGTGSAAMMRLLAGLLVVLGLFDHSSPASDTDADDGDADVRWVPASASAFGLVGVALGVLSFWFDGHTVTRGPRVIHAVVDLVHVAAGGIWFGGLVGLSAVAFVRRGRTVAPLLLRFSPVASAALVLVALAGALMTLMVIDHPGDLTGTEWGRLLLIKVAAVGAAALVGAYNHFVVVPALDASPADRGMAARARVAVVVEAVLLAFVVAVTVFLTAASIT